LNKIQEYIQDMNLKNSILYWDFFNKIDKLHFLMIYIIVLLSSLYQIFIIQTYLLYNIIYSFCLICSGIFDVIKHKYNEKICDDMIRTKSHL